LSHDGGFDKPFATLRAAQPPSLRWLASQLLHALTHAPCGRFFRLAGGAEEAAAQEILRVFRQIQELLVLLSEKKSFEKLEQSKNSDKNTFKLNFCRKIIE
jgi:hypothetical protein